MKPHPYDDIQREIAEARGIDPELDGITLTPAEVAAMAGKPARRYKRRTHAEVEEAAYQRGYFAGYSHGQKDRDEIADKKAAEKEAEHVNRLESMQREAYFAGIFSGVVMVVVTWWLS